MRGLVCLASGVGLGLGTAYGLLRYWWVVIKLGINIAFVALVPVGLLAWGLWRVDLTPRAPFLAWRRERRT